MVGAGLAAVLAGMLSATNFVAVCETVLYVGTVRFRHWDSVVASRRHGSGWRWCSGGGLAFDCTQDGVEHCVKIWRGIGTSDSGAGKGAV